MIRRICGPEEGEKLSEDERIYTLKNFETFILHRIL
jgi:hypothetical protein